MRNNVLAFAASLLFIANSSAGFPQSPSPTTSSALAANILAQSDKVLTRSVNISDVTLTGIVQRVAGSEDETGTVVMMALSTGETREDLNFPSGLHSEIRWAADKHRKGQWTGPDGVSHTISPHNLMVDSAWFFPALLMHRLSSSQDFVVSHPGSELRNDGTVEHLSASRSFSLAPEGIVPMLQRASQMEVYLDPVTLLPSALTFNVHPDMDAGRDLLVEIRFSDYRVVDGVQTPFHIQKYLNNSLVLDLQFQSVSLNKGLSQSTFSAQRNTKSTKGDAR